MKRRMCSMILTGILVFALSACGGDSGNKKETDQDCKVVAFPGTKKIYPNDPCPCGSGKKYKHCCGRKKK